jgi:prepilin peptidase CpaA
VQALTDLHTIAVGVAIGLLALAAWRDVALRLIPDWISISVAVLGMVVRLQLSFLDFAFSLVTAIFVFSLLLMAFSRGLLGGGDVKLISALVLWLSPPDCYVLVMAITAAGGVLALAHLLVRHCAPIAAIGAGAGRMMRVEMKRIRAGGPLPYGVAIMVGGTFTLLRALGG